MYPTGTPTAKMMMKNMTTQHRLVQQDDGRVLTGGRGVKIMSSPESSFPWGGIYDGG